VQKSLSVHVKKTVQRDRCELSVLRYSTSGEQIPTEYIKRLICIDTRHAAQRTWNSSMSACTVVLSPATCTVRNRTSSSSLSSSLATSAYGNARLTPEERAQNKCVRLCNRAGNAETLWRSRPNKITGCSNWKNDLVIFQVQSHVKLVKPIILK